MRHAICRCSPGGDMLRALRHRVLVPVALCLTGLAVVAAVSCQSTRGRQLGFMGGGLLHRVRPQTLACRRCAGHTIVRVGRVEEFCITLAENVPMEPGAGEVTQEQLIVGFVAGLFPFVWAAYEFWKRIDTQQRCGVCQGSGLVSVWKNGRTLQVPRKCYACGGFIPWLDAEVRCFDLSMASQGWRAFWLSNLDIGNGGVLQRPAADYESLSKAAKEGRAMESRRKGGAQDNEQ